MFDLLDLRCLRVLSKGLFVFDLLDLRCLRVLSKVLFVFDLLDLRCLRVLSRVYGGAHNSVMGVQGFADSEVGSLATADHLWCLQIASLLETLPKQPTEENEPLSTLNLSTLKTALCELKGEQVLLERNISISQTMLEDKRKRAIQGENIFQDTEIILWETESNLRAIKVEVEDVERLKEAVQFQLQEMKKGAGVSLWPKPVLHPSSPSSLDLPLQIDVTACAFCRRGYSCMDVVVAPCMHMFHPFCIAEVARHSNKCNACDTLFHPQWWTSWGFRDLDEEFKVESEKLGLKCQREDLLQAMIEEHKERAPSGKYMITTFVKPLLIVLRLGFLNSGLMLIVMGRFLRVLLRLCLGVSRVRGVVSIVLRVLLRYCLVQLKCFEFRVPSL